MNRRRRSATVAFSVLGLSGLAAGCDPAPEPRVYSSVAECAAEQGASICNSAWQASVGEHQASAPQFVARENCEDQYGAGHCQAVSTDHGSYFIPMMAGFTVARILARRDDRDQSPSGGGFGGYVGRPVLFNRSGGFSGPDARPGEALFAKGAGFTERAGFGRAGGFRFGFRGG